MDPLVFLSTCVTTICSAYAGAAVIANPKATNSADPKVFSIRSLQICNDTDGTCKEVCCGQESGRNAFASTGRSVGVRDSGMFGAVEERGERGGTTVHAKLVQFTHFPDEGTLKGSRGNVTRGHCLADGHGDAPSGPIVVKSPA